MAIPPKPRGSRTSRSRFFPLLLVIPFLFGMFFPIWIVFFPRFTDDSPPGLQAPETFSNVGFFPFDVHVVCQPRLLLDTPAGVGFNALHGALSLMLPGEAVVQCHAPDGCNEFLAGVCNGTLAAPVVVMGYLRADGDIVDCLRAQHKYYSAVAVRAPLERWSAEYLGTGRVRPYLEWMALYPDCSLLHYFDGLGYACSDDDDVYGRVLKVAERFDEGMDVYVGIGGSLYGKVRDLIGERVGWVAPSKAFKFRFLGMNRLIGETTLYEVLVALRASEGRSFCY